MIKAIIFDLDGTLVQTEILKADSYAKAVFQLTSGIVEKESVLNIFQDYVGLSRSEVASGLITLFGAEIKKSSEVKINDELIELLIKTRMTIYEGMISNPEVLIGYFCKYNIGLLNSVYEDNYLTGLATMSHCAQVEKVLDTMSAKHKFKYVITREEVSKGKPDPEIYLKMTDKLNVKPGECIVVEDSVTGFKAAQKAGTNVFAVTNSITKKSVHQSRIIADKFIVDDPQYLKSTIYNSINESVNEN